MFDWNRKEPTIKGWEFVSKKSNKVIFIEEREAAEAFTDKNGFNEENRENILDMKIGETLEILDCQIKFGFIKKTIGA